MNKRMKDIAKEANVSVATVSRVIHKNGYVSKSTKDKIIEIIKRENYSLDLLAQSLRKRISNTIGFLMTQIYPDPFQSMISMFLENEAKRKGYRLLINNTLGNETEEKYAINLFIRYRVDGIIFGYLNDKKNITQLQEYGIPFVLIERMRNLDNVNAVVFDYYRAIQMSFDHLVSKGAKRIGLIGARLGDNVENQIFQSYKDSLDKLNIPLDDNIVHLDWMNAKTGCDGIKKFTSANKIPDACIIINDITTLGALQTLSDLNIKVPDEFMIISCDNTLSGFSTPPVTSISFKKEVIAKKAFSLVLEKIKKKDFENKIITLEPTLVLRKSTKD